VSPVCVAEWKPWWQETEDSHERQFVHPLVSEVREVCKGEQDCDNFPCTAAQPPKSLHDLGFHGTPAPSVVFNIAEVVFCYAYVIRLYYGDWRTDPAAVCSELLSLSQVLSQDARYDSVGIAVNEAIAAALRAPAVAVSATVAVQRAFVFSLLSDVQQIMSSCHYVADALADVGKMARAAAAAATTSRQRTRLTRVVKKAEFLCAWACAMSPVSLVDVCLQVGAVHAAAVEVGLQPSTVSVK
jgi:hypothetical protein